jgi:hypothetical protein
MITSLEHQIARGGAVRRFAATRSGGTACCGNAVTPSRVTARILAQSTIFAGDVNRFSGFGTVWHVLSALAASWPILDNP